MKKKGSSYDEREPVFFRLMKYREEVDCNPSYDFSANEAGQLKQETEELAGRIRAQLRETGLLGR